MRCERKGLQKHREENFSIRKPLYEDQRLEPNQEGLKEVREKESGLT